MKRLTLSTWCQLTIVSDKGLLPPQVAELQQVADACAAENLGMPAVYTVTGAVGDWLLANNVDPGVGALGVCVH